MWLTQAGMLNSLFAMLPFSILNENVLHSVIYSSEGKSVPLTSLVRPALRFLYTADHFCNPGTVTQTGDGFSSRVDSHVDKRCRMCLWHRIFHRSSFYRLLLHSICELPRWH